LLGAYKLHILISMPAMVTVDDCAVETRPGLTTMSKNLFMRLSAFTLADSA